MSAFTNGTYRVYGANIPINFGAPFDDSEVDSLRKGLAARLYARYLENLDRFAQLTRQPTQEIRRFALVDEVYDDVTVENTFEVVTPVRRPAGDINVLSFRSYLMTTIVMIFVSVGEDSSIVLARTTEHTSYILRRMEERRQLRGLVLELTDFSDGQIAKLIDSVITSRQSTDFGDVDITYNRNGPINDLLKLINVKVPSQDLVALLEKHPEESAMEVINNFIHTHTTMDFAKLQPVKVLTELVNIAADGRIKIWGGRLRHNQNFMWMMLYYFALALT